MSLTRLRISNLRCITTADFEFSGRSNFVVGPNGAGKTSLLEAIYLLGRGRSFRTRHTRGLIRFSEESLTVFGETAADQSKLGVEVSGDGLSSRVNGEGGGGLSALARLFPVHVIDPKLHALIESGPSERRRFIDGGVFHVEHTYLDRWRAYRRVLSQRNAALKRGRIAEIEVWTAPLIEAGLAVHQLRRAYLDGLAPRVAESAKRLSGLSLKMNYLAGWRAETSFGEALASSWERDRQTGTTQVGPHRADIGLRVEGQRLKDVASRGQQKLVAAALVLGQVGQFEAQASQTGTLLVDDPAAELDDDSLQGLIRELDLLRAQKIITGLRLQTLKANKTDPTFHVKHGKFEPVVY